MAFAAVYTDKFARFGIDASYLGLAPSSPVLCRVRFAFAGLTDVGHGVQDQALIKVLWTDFPQHPTGKFLINGVEWKVLEAAGTVDGHREGLQRALLCGCGRKFSVEK